MKFIKPPKIVKLIIASFFTLGLTLSCDPNHLHLYFYIDMPANMAQSESVVTYLYGFNYYLNQQKDSLSNFEFSIIDFAASTHLKPKPKDIEVVIASTDFKVNLNVPFISPFFKPLNVVYQESISHFPMTSGVTADTLSLLELVREQAPKEPIFIYSDEALYEEAVINAMRDLDRSYSTIKIEKGTINFEGVYHYISTIESDSYVLLLNPHDFVSLYYHFVEKKNVVPVYLPSFVTRYHQEIINKNVTFPLYYLINKPFTDIEMLFSDALLASRFYDALSEEDQKMIIRHQVSFSEGYFIASFIMSALKEVSYSTKVKTDFEKALHTRYQSLSIDLEAYNK